jgi:5,10-methylenetetrahydromethanopterin reductase
MIGIELTPEHPVDRLATLGAQAETAGADTVFTSCHYNNRDPFVALAAIAERTETVRLGPGVANPYQTHPAALASQVATVAEVSDGRAVYGIGAGDGATLRALDVERDRPLRRVLESMQVARKLWDGERVTMDGAVTVTDARLNYDPPGEMPVYVGAQGPDMLRMAGKHADGVLINASHPDDVAWASERVAEGVAERPAERGDCDVAAYTSVSVADDETAAREAARPPVGFIVGSAAEPTLQRHDIDAKLAAEIGTAIEAGRFSDAFEMVTPAMLDAFAVAGDPETVTAQLEAVAAHVDSIVAGAPLGPDLDSAVGLATAAVRRAIA